MVKLFSLVPFLLLAAVSTAEAQQTPGANGVEQQTFALINQYRKTGKLPLLTWDGAIAKMARAHSRDMATGEVDFGHEGFSDRVSRLKSDLPGFWSAGENVFMTDNPDRVARNAVERWLHSPHHLENIRGDYNYSGLGVWQDKKGAIYFTQIFVKIQAPKQEAQAGPPPSVVAPFGMLTAPDTHSRP